MIDSYLPIHNIIISTQSWYFVTEGFDYYYFSYIGLVITDITAPLPKTTKWKTIHEIKNGTIVTSFYNTMEPKWSKCTNSETWDDPGCKHSLNYLWTNFGVEVELTCTEWNDNKTHSLTSLDRFCSKMYPILDLIKGEFRVNIEARIANLDCDSLTVFLTPNKDIDYQLAHVKNLNPKKPFYKGKDELHSYPEGWKISKHGVAIQKRLGVLVSSGIYKMLKDLTDYKKELEKKLLIGLKKGVKPHSLDSNGIIVFHLYFICSSISIFGFFLEWYFKDMLILLIYLKSK